MFFYLNYLCFKFLESLIKNYVRGFKIYGMGDKWDMGFFLVK